MFDVYVQCPTYLEKSISLIQTRKADAQDLLKCYSDEKSVPIFNSDNCNGDDFHYTTIERMNEEIDLWDFSYQQKHFIRWSVVLKDTQERIGTIEMFHRIANDEFNDYGVLRIDLQSKYETKEIILEILRIANQHFYNDFDVKIIVTKAVPIATERICALKTMGYLSLGKKFSAYDDYYFKKIE